MRLMPKGVAVKSMRHASSERYEFVIDSPMVPAGALGAAFLIGGATFLVNFFDT